MHELDPIFTKFKRQTRIRNLFCLIRIKTFQFWDSLLAFLFNYSTRCYARKTPLKIEKLKNPCASLKYFSDNFGRFSTSKSLIGVVSHDSEDLEITQHLLHTIYDYIKSAKVAELATAEVLAKVVSYRDLKEGVKIEIPIKVSESQIELVSFTVDSIFDLWHKHVAFGLIPTNTKITSPILLFRGTDFSITTEGGRASIISDLDPESPGKKLFLHSRSEIRQWLQQISHVGKKARVIGHSLGGALAIYTAIYENTFISEDPLEPSFAFNPPGISEELSRDWGDVCKEEKPNISSYVTRGDIVSKFGQIFENSYEIFTSKPLAPMIAHEQLIFSQPLFYLCKIDPIVENSSKSRSYYSTIQKQTTSLAYKFGLKHLFPNQL